MLEWFASLGVLEKVYAVFGISGSILFVVRLVMMFMGMDGESDGDGDFSGADGADGDGDLDGDSDSSDIAFKLLSLQGLTAFFMMFGLSGLALSRDANLTSVLSIPISTAIGLSSVWVIAKLFALFNKLQNSGTMDLRNAIGQEGKVYLTIPEGDTGKVQVAIQGHLKVMNAVSEDRQAIPTDSRVVVTGLVGGNVLVVKVSK